jgi:hypothetical protein
MRHLAKINKRGQSQETLMWVVRGLILAFVLLSIVAVSSSFLSRNVETRVVDSFTVMNMLYFSEKGNAFEDSKTGRIYSGLVDLSRSGILDTRITLGEDVPLALKKTITFPGFSKEFTYDSEKFKNWNSLFKAGLTKEVFKVSLERNRVVRETSGEKQLGNVKVEVVTKNANVKE